MKSKSVPGILCAAGFIVLVIICGKSEGEETANARVPVRIGWQVPAATQAQIVQVLKRTNVLETQGLEPRLVPFSFGTPEIEAALAGRLDVLFAGDQPAINLIARGGKWKIAARLFYDRIAVMVPPGSPIRQLKDLMGKTVASPFGSTAQRVVFQQEAAVLKPDKDVRNVDLDILEIRRLVQAGGIGSWGQIDAVTVWEPTASQFELERLARSLSDVRTLGVVAFSDDFIANHSEAAVQFLVALVRAWYYFSQNPDRVRQWYIDDTKLGYSPEALLAAARVNPNFGAKSLGDIDLSLTDKDMASLQQAAAWAREQGYAGGAFRIDPAVDQSLLAKAMTAVAADRFERIQVILPSAREAPMVEGAKIHFLDRLPLLVIFGLMIVIAFLGIEAGQLAGRRRRRKAGNQPEGPIGTVVGAVLGLLAFVIALTFAAASNRFDARKQALLDEVNAIGTAYLRAGLLPEPQRATTRILLRDYVEIRLDMYRVYGQPEKLRTVQGRTAALQESIWSDVETLAEADRHSPIYAIFASSLNDVFDLHTKRVVLGAEYRIPFFEWCALGLVSFLAMMAVGFQFGIGGRRSLMASFMLSLAFALVILLIFALDRPGEGLINVSQRPMIELYRSLSK